MKTIKPKTKNVIINSEPVKDSNNLDTKLSTNLIQDEPIGTIEDLMDSVLKNNNYIVNANVNVNKPKDDRIQVTINLTKRQYDLYTKKGGESWLKKALVGVKQGKKKKKQENEK